MKDNNIINSTKAIVQSREEFEERKNRSKPSLSDLSNGNIDKPDNTNLNNISNLVEPGSTISDENIIDINEISKDDSLKEQEEYINNTVDINKSNPSTTSIESELNQLDEDIISDTEMPNHIDNLISELRDMDEDPITENTILEDLTRLAKEKIGNSKMKKIDLNTFVVANEPINLLKVMENTSTKINTADWVLMNTGKRISMKEFSGIEIEMLNPKNSRRNRYNTIMDIFGNIHNHILNNPISTEVKTFLKSVNYTDLDSLYYAIYRASFNDSNKITYICEKCNHVFLNDVNIDDMYKFKDDKAEEKFWDIYERGEEELISSRVIREQISNDFVMDIAPASIYSIMVESALLDDNFLYKYNQIIGMLSFIRQIYKIDHNTAQLIPIKLKEYDGDESKTLQYKILTYAQILRSLNSYEYSKLRNIIESIGEEDDGLQYVIPEAKCEECGYKIPEEITSGDTLVFTRHRLDILANS